jgi:WD40 repeat protein
VLAAAAGRKLLFLNRDGSIIHAFKESPKTLSAIAWHPGGGAIATASFDRVVIWDADDFRIQREYAYGGAIETLAWSPNGRWLVAGAQNNAVHLWIPEEDQEFHMSGYETKVRELSFSSDSRWLATGGSRDACVWDCTGAGPEGREPIALPHANRVCAIAFQHTHDLLATAANDGEAAFWRLTNGETRVATVKLTAPASNLAWSPTDTLLAIGSQTGGVLVLAVAL